MTVQLVESQKLSIIHNFIPSIPNLLKPTESNKTPKRMSKYTAVQTSEEGKHLQGELVLNELESGQHRPHGGSNASGSPAIRSREASVSSYAGRDRAPTYTPAAPDNAPTVLTFSNITVTTKTANKKTLLDDVSGSITGGFWAIMGASGGGKTTLLSTLSLRLDTNYMDITGEFRLNGREYSRHDLKAMSAYVMQDDLLHAELTVYETLHYAAQLRMGSYATSDERKSRIEEVMTLMGISNCRDVIIGDSRHKGISGGERKRVSVAMELLNRPKLLFLDEPTSGLDSTTALLVCEALKRLSQLGECTVICTIHQPQPKIFELFDNLILMKKGTIVYQGPAFKTEAFLQKLGFPLPDDMAIADHLLDVISPTNEDGEVLDNERDKKVIPVNLSLGIEKELDMTHLSRSWLEQFGILFTRNFNQYRRNTSTILLSLCVSVLLAVFTGSGLWNQIGTTQLSVPLRVPSLFFICVTQGIVGSLQSINSFPSERAIMLRERQAGAYCVSAYFAAKTVVDLLTQIWPTFIFCCIVYPLIGYRPGADHFFLIFFFYMFKCIICG